MLDGKTQIYIKLQHVTRGGFDILQMFLNEELRDKWMDIIVTTK